VETSSLQSLIDQVRKIAQEPALPEADDLKTNESTLNHLEDFAKTIIVELGQEVDPMFVLQLRNNHQIPIVMELGDETKDQSAELIRILAQATGAVRYTFISEAWCKKMHKDQLSDFRKSNIHIRDSEDKIEVVVLMVSDGEGTITRSLEIVRDWETGKATELRSVMPDCTENEGRFAGLIEA
jgi:hypothetical protein